MIPKDNQMLLSIINCKLRDQYASFKALCDDLDYNESEINERLTQLGYFYEAALNRFVINNDIVKYLQSYPISIRSLYYHIEALIYQQCPKVEFSFWAKLPTYTYASRFVRLIPFKDHINIEAIAIKEFANELNSKQLTNKFFLKLSSLDDKTTNTLLKVFTKTLISETI